MLAGWWIALGLLQTQVDPVKRVELAQAVVTAQASAQAQANNAQTAEERHQFEEKFNHLVSAMDAFQREYNASGGHVWPKKEANALKKAIKDLQLR